MSAGTYPLSFAGKEFDDSSVYGLVLITFIVWRWLMVPTCLVVNVFHVILYTRFHIVYTGLQLL